MIETSSSTINLYIGFATSTTDMLWQMLVSHLLIFIIACIPILFFLVIFNLFIKDTT